ncbi:MAG TPA: tetratricopeptide repeat protein, partial [Cryomorphaceae bacterium]|nr:tetratricopeptide repeat protein [Cryomorphaceae bacterium]
FSLIFSDRIEAKQKIDEVLQAIEESQGKSRTYYNIYQNLGIYFDVHQETDSARAIFTEILQESKKSGWDTLLRKAYNNLGMNSLNSSHYRQAIDCFSAALELTRNSPGAAEADYVNYISNLGLANQELEMYDQAIKYHDEALAIRERIKDENGISISCANLGICYKLMGRERKAINYFQRAIEAAQSAGNRNQYHRVHDNLGSLYIGMGNYTEGLKMLETALDTADGYVLDPKLKLSVISNSAAAYLDLKQPNKAEAFAKKGLNILRDYPELINYSPTLYNALAKIHFLKGDFERGNSYLETFQNINKAVFNSENVELLTDLQVKYDLEKKENRIALQNAQIQETNALLQRNYFAFAAIGLLIVLLSATFVYRQNRNKREQELKWREASIRAALDSQEDERRRMAKDLHDGFGQYITTLRIYVSQFKIEGTDPKLKQELILRSGSVLDEMSKEIGNVVFDLMPATLVHYGLVNALDELAQRINAGKKIQVTLSAKGIQKTPDEESDISLFRICQEWINNVMKYAEASEVLITLHQSDGIMTLSVRDDGYGFDPEVLNDTTQNGWKNIRTRARILNAELTLLSKSGVKGTEFLVVYPQLIRLN